MMDMIARVARAISAAGDKEDGATVQELSRAAIEAMREPIARLRAALQECADDLEVEVRARFVDSAGMVHPALRQRYERDMGPVVRARAALTTTEGQ